VPADVEAEPAVLHGARKPPHQVVRLHDQHRHPAAGQLVGRGEPRGAGTDHQDRFLRACPGKAM